MEKDKFLKSHFYDEYIAFAMFITGLIQLATCVKLDYKFYIIWIEEAILVIYIIIRECQIYKFNRIISNGRMIKGVYDIHRSNYNSYMFKGVVRYILNIYCIAEGKAYTGKLNVENGTEEYKTALVEVLKNNGIPLVVERNGNYVLLVKEMISEHFTTYKKCEIKTKNKVIFFMILRYIALIFCFLSL